MNDHTAVRSRPRRESVAIRTLRALEFIAPQPRSAAEVARELDVNRSTALRLLRELEEAGYVARDHGKLYTVAVGRFARLAAGGGVARDWITSLTPIMASVRDETKESTVIGVPAGDVMVYAALFESTHPVAVRERLGTTRPMHASALGKAYLAKLDGRELEAHLSALGFEGGTSHAAQNVSELRQALELVYDQGYATDRNETLDGLSCVAVAVSIGGTLVGACGVSAPSSRVSDEKLAEYGTLLRQQIRSSGAVDAM